MYEHLKHFLSKIAAAQAGSPAIVPSFPPASGVNTGMASPPPQPPPFSVKALDPPVKAGAPLSLGSGSAKMPSAPKATSSSTSGMSKGSAVKSVLDFTQKVRGPLTDMRKEQYTAAFDDDPVEWGAPTSFEGGDAGARMGVAGPGTKTALLGGAAAKGGSSLLRGLARPASVTDVASTAGFAPMTFEVPKANLSTDEVKQRASQARTSTKLTGFGSGR